MKIKKVNDKPMVIHTKEKAKIHDWEWQDDTTLNARYVMRRICNLFWSDDAEEAKAFFDMGIDVILTNHFLKTSGTV